MCIGYLCQAACHIGAPSVDASVEFIDNFAAVAGGAVFLAQPPALCPLPLNTWGSPYALSDNRRSLDTVSIIVYIYIIIYAIVIFIVFIDGFLFTAFRG